jgi:DNA-binding Xre family transcriptional regulator
LVVVGEIVGLIFKPCKGFGLISELLKRVMAECNLKQSDLVDLLGVSLSRVKAMSSGRVKNLTRAESEALVKKLHIRGDWLATGEGPMFQSPGERELHRRLDIVKATSGKALVQGLNSDDASRLAEILFFADLGDAAALQKVLNPFAPDEVALVLSYRKCSVEGRAHLIQTAALLAAGLPGGSTPAAGRVGGKFSQHNVGDNAVQIGSVGGKRGVKGR